MVFSKAKTLTDFNGSSPSISRKSGHISLLSCFWLTSLALQTASLLDDIPLPIPKQLPISQIQHSCSCMSDTLLQEATHIKHENPAGSTSAPALQGHPCCAMPTRAKGLLLLWQVRFWARGYTWKRSRSSRGQTCFCREARIKSTMQMENGRGEDLILAPHGNRTGNLTLFITPPERCFGLNFLCFIIQN